MQTEIIPQRGSVAPQGGFVLQTRQWAVVPSWTVKRITELSVNEMLVTIGRAYLASGQEFAVSDLRLLSVPRMLQEYQWSVAYLSAKGLLSETEERRAGQYASEFLESPFE